MNRAPSTRSAPGSIQKYVGTAYDEILAVNENLDSIIAVADALPYTLMYLGPSAVPPTTRLDGSELQDGDYYLDTVDEAFHYYIKASDSWTVIDASEIFDARDVTLQAAAAAAISEENAASSESNAANSESGAAVSANSASTYASNASSSSTSAAASAVIASDAATVATTKEAEASNHSSTASDAAIAASNSETSAQNSASSATNSENIASDAAITATTKASEASASAGIALDAQTAAELARDEAVAAASISEPMSEAVYQSLCDMQQKVMAASGFVEWGKVLSGSASINEGLWTFPSAGYENQLLLGRSENNTEGRSKADAPLINANGSLINLNLAASVYTPNKLKFPPAPNGAQSNELNYETEIDPKYGDIAQDLNEAVARCFEGEVKNGDFRFGDDGSWALSGSGAGTATIDNTGFQFNGDNTSASCYMVAEYQFSVSAGNIYQIEFISEYAHPAGEVWIQFALDWGNKYSGEIKAGVNRIEIIGPSDMPSVSIQINPRVVNVLAKFSNVSVRNKDNPVVINRQDYWFTEVWDELIEEKDVFVPGGLVQYGSNSWNGIALSQTWCPDEYAAFFKGDDTKGYFQRWSTMSVEDKAKAWNDPNNHIRQLADGRLVQRRTRIRTIAGKEGSWDYVSPMDAERNKSLSFSEDNPQLRVIPQGLRASSLALGPYSSGNGDYLSQTATTGSGVVEGSGDDGLWGVRSAGNENVGYGGFCIAIPGGLVARYNQGAYHPVWNSSGANSWVSSGDGYGNTWERYGKLITSTRRCFDSNNRVVTIVPHSSGSVGGFIASGYSGRPDDRFYDGIYAANVKDERISARVRPKAEVLEEFKTKAITGEVRGWEKMPFLTPVLAAGGSPFYAPNGWAIGKEVGIFTENHDVTKYSTNLQFKTYRTIHLLASNDEWIEVRCKGDLQSGFRISGDVVAVSTGWTTQAVQLVDDGLNKYYSPAVGVTIYASNINEVNSPSTKHSWTDIIGSPSNIMATFPDGVAAMWVPVVPDGITPYTDFKLNRKAIEFVGDMIYTSDNGDTWLTASATLDEVNNVRNSTSNHPTNRISLFNYTTPANFTEPADNSRVLAIGDVFVTAWNDIAFTGNIISTLINKVATSNAAASAKHVSQMLTLVDKGVLKESGEFPSVIYAYPEHQTVGLYPPNNKSPAIKVLFTLTEVNGRLAVQCRYKELIYDVDWGDDALIPISDNQSTMLDTSGNTVLFGTATLTTPFIYAENEES